MPEDLDKMVKGIEADKQARLQEEEKAQEMLQIDEETANHVLEQRKNKISGFKLNLDLEGSKQEEAGKSDASGTSDTPKAADSPKKAEKPVPDVPETAANAPETARTPEHTKADPLQTEKPDGAGDGGKTDTGKAAVSKENSAKNSAALKTAEKEEKPKTSGRKKESTGCLSGAIYAVIILVLSGLLAVFLIVCGLDVTGLNKSDTKVPVTLTEEQCNNTAEVAKVLKEAGIIDHPLLFRLYCKMTKEEGQFQPQDELALSPDMGYGVVINDLKSNNRQVVKVTFPEGATIQEIAAKLEANNICTATEFYNALDSDKYNYDFLNDIPTDDAHSGRFYKLEGYMFPDTYQFYVGSSGESVVKKFLDNFNSRVDISMRSAIKANGMTLNDTIVLASLIQWEAGNKDSMSGISCVLHNRLNDPADYPKLECDSTRRYINTMQPPVNGQDVENLDYDTYKRTGLPVGAINNPGLEAIQAAINPATEGDAVSCYFFATDMKTGETYYSKTYADHVKVCKKYNIGMYTSD